MAIGGNMYAMESSEYFWHKFVVQPKFVDLKTELLLTVECEFC